MFVTCHDSPRFKPFTLKRILFSAGISYFGIQAKFLMQALTSLWSSELNASDNKDTRVLNEGLDHCQVRGWNSALFYAF